MENIRNYETLLERRMAGEVDAVQQEPAGYGPKVDWLRPHPERVAGFFGEGGG